MIVLISGRVNVVIKDKFWDNIGKRMSVFEKILVYLVYVLNDD